MDSCGNLWDYGGSIWVPCVYWVFDDVSYHADGDWYDHLVAHEQEQNHLLEIPASWCEPIFIGHRQQYHQFLGAFELVAQI